jgi:hypothetical protein
MAPRLQQMLADDWELLACSPGKPLVEPGAGATLQYRLELRQRGAGGTVERLVAGRVFLSDEAAERFSSQVDQMVERVAGRDDLGAFARPVLLVRELRLVVHALPLDPALPGLVVATDAAALVRMLGPVLTSSVPGLVLQACHTEVVRYRPGTCVLRYELAWSLEHSRRSLKQVVYGTVYGDGRGRLVGPAVTALQRAAEGPGSSLPFLVPRFHAYLPDLRLTLLEAVPGSPLLPALIRRGARGAAADSGPAPEGAVAASARTAAAVHRSSIPVGPVRTLAGEVEEVEAAIDTLAPLAPTLAASLHRDLRTVADVALDLPGTLGVAHGDFRPSQVLFDGPTTSLVAFDRVCRAEPALDLGSFTAHLAAVGTRDGGQDLGSVFLREYLRWSGGSDSGDLLGRVAAYRTVALARLAVRRWCQLKPQRPGPGPAALDLPTPGRRAVNPGRKGARLG